MKKLTPHGFWWTSWAAVLIMMVPEQATAAGRISNNYDTAKPLELNQRYEGALPVGEGRQCFRVNVPDGQRVSIRGSNNYGTVFFSAYSGRGNVLIGETQVLASYQPQGVVETEESDGAMMVCVDSDTLQRQTDHRYSLQVSIAGAAPKVVATTINREPAYPQPKARKDDSNPALISPYVESPLQLAANSRSFPLRRDGGVAGDAGNNSKTARLVSLNQMYSGYLNASRGDDRDCYTYPDLPNNSKLRVAIANNDGILGMSAYSNEGQILIGQVYMIKQETTLETEATGGNIMVCVDTDGEKSDHQYTFEAQIKR